MAQVDLIDTARLATLLEPGERCRRSAAWARDAGFDGLELDATGVAPTDLIRLEDTLQSVFDGWAPDRVGIRLSPFAWLAAREDIRAADLWDDLLCTLSGVELAYLQITGTFSRDRGDFATSPLGQHLRGAFHGLLIVSGAYTQAEAIAVVDGRWADAVGFELVVGNGDDLVTSITKSVRAVAAGKRSRFELDRNESS